MVRRWHDNRRTLLTDLAESGSGETIMDITGHVSKRMLRHYNDIRMGAKRTALESIDGKQTTSAANEAEESRSANGEQSVGYPHRAQGYKEGCAIESELRMECPESPTLTQHVEVEYPQKCPQFANFETHRGVGRGGKSKKRTGSSGRNRIINQTDFQQHAGQRMTPKTMKSSDNQINRALIERGVRS